MSDPVIVPCPADQWTKVATAVKTGVIDKYLKDPNIYLRTYRDTGGAAPTDTEDAVNLFEGCNSATISSNVSIDVYVYPRNKAGKVRVSL